MPVKCNLNDDVWVKPTAKGIETIVKHYADLPVWSWVWIHPSRQKLNFLKSCLAIPI